MKPLLKDERIEKRIGELELESQASGDEVRIMLAEQRAASEVQSADSS